MINIKNTEFHSYEAKKILKSFDGAYMSTIGIALWLGLSLVQADKIAQELCKNLSKELNINYYDKKVNFINTGKLINDQKLFYISYSGKKYRLYECDDPECDISGENVYYRIEFPDNSRIVNELSRKEKI